MQTKQEQRFCKKCDDIMPVSKRVPSHILHLLLSLCTAGMWLIIWLLVTLVASSNKFKCVKCGTEIKD